jgi:hypothetical protein
MSTSPFQEVPVHCTVQMMTTRETVIFGCVVHIIGTSVYLPVKLYYPDTMPVCHLTVAMVKQEAIALCNRSLTPHSNRILLVDTSPPVDSV